MKQLQALLPAILVGLNETHERLVEEAITALGSILRHHRDRVNISSICVRIAKTLRPFLDDVRQREKEGSYVCGGGAGYCSQGKAVPFVRGQPPFLIPSILGSSCFP